MILASVDTFCCIPLALSTPPGIFCLPLHPDINIRPFAQATSRLEFCPYRADGLFGVMEVKSDPTNQFRLSRRLYSLPVESGGADGDTKALASLVSSYAFDRRVDDSTNTVIAKYPGHSNVLLFGGEEEAGIKLLKFDPDAPSYEEHQLVVDGLFDVDQLAGAAENDRWSTHYCYQFDFALGILFVLLSDGTLHVVQY